MNRIIISLAVLLMAVSCAGPQGYVTFTGYAQGGTYSVKYNTSGVLHTPEQVRDSVESILMAVDASLSGYNRNSLLSRFNAGERIVPDSLFIDVYSKAYEVFDLTGGVVDAASAPLFDIWGFGFKSGQMPSDELVRTTMASCGMDRLVRNIGSLSSRLSGLSSRDILEEPSQNLPELNYNAIAQGYSCDLVASYLYSIGVKDMMVNIGEIFCDGDNPSGTNWTIGIDRPLDGNDSLGSDVQAVFRVPPGPHGVVTSGNYRKFYVRDGKKYAHTIDPMSGYPVSHNLLSATIVAPDALMADAYATYCMAIGLDRSVEFIESDPQLEGCLIYDLDGEFHIWCSAGMDMR